MSGRWSRHLSETSCSICGDGKISNITPGAGDRFGGISKEAVDAEYIGTSFPFQRRSSSKGSAICPEVAAKTKERHPTVARFALSSQIPPKLTDALPVAERIHLALVELSDGSSIFTGCDELGKPLQGNAHAYILPESNPGLGRGGRGEITHITIYAPAGFGPREMNALEDLRAVWGDCLDVQLTLMGVGWPEDFGGLDVARGQCALMAEARCWISRTPFIPTRHYKITRAGVPKLDSNGLQIGSPEHDLRRLLRLEGFPEPMAVEPVSFTDLAGQRMSWSGFHRSRSSGDGRRAGRIGYGFRVEFSESVQGPVAVGYGAHFGMGMFAPIKSVMD